MDKKDYTETRQEIIEANIGCTMEDLYDDAYSQAREDILGRISEFYKRLESYNYESKTVKEINMKDPNLDLKTTDPLLISAILHLGQHQAYENALKLLKNKFKLEWNIYNL